MSYEDILNAIEQSKGSYIELIMDSISKSFLIMIKKDFIKFGYRIIIGIEYLSDIEKLNNLIKNINEKTIIFFDSLFVPKNNVKLNLFLNSSCIIIFLSKYSNSKHNFNFNYTLSFMTSLIISIVSNNLRVLKSRYTNTYNNEILNITILLRKNKLEELEYNIKNNKI
jgi:hypothetical protein